MATTDHPLVLDLGSVVGPQGPTGPQGPSGVATTSGEPSPSVGSDGDIMIDPSTGIFYKKVSGAWTTICTVLLAPLDTEIDDESTNGVTNAAIAVALGEKIPSTSTTTTMSVDGTGTYDGACQVNNFGPIGFLALSSANRSEDVWKRTITIGGSASSATAIATIPEGVRPTKTDYVMGRLLTASKAYRAEFTIASAYGDNPGVIFCNSLLDDDFNRVMSGSDPVSQVVATGFNISACYRVAGT